MDNLYYSPSEKMVFWIAGYVDFTGTYRNIPNVMEYAEQFQRKFAAKEVKTKIIKSAGNKGKRLFFASIDSQPVGAFNIGERRNMDEWLSQ
ncbi:hypothetical protein [Candidatus Thiodiazotropha sp. CDECU1]|uniref:hypothetical protein n=1 Tax=Candidatus Thiodiazotropha sp. CDECU1 TaxID=3065865 RepID=UPI00292CC79D|nr:hypothetical protein [Candidatus Thiodiazotropha sp. CDECU1]